MTRRRRRQLSAEKHRSETRRNSQVYIVVLQIVGKSELGTGQLVQQQEPTTCVECGITGGIKQVRRERASERGSVLRRACSPSSRVVLESGGRGRESPAGDVAGPRHELGAGRPACPTRTGRIQKVNRKTPPLNYKPGLWVRGGGEWGIILATIFSKTLAKFTLK